MSEKTINIPLTIDNQKVYPNNKSVFKLIKLNSFLTFHTFQTKNQKQYLKRIKTRGII